MMPTSDSRGKAENSTPSVYSVSKRLSLSSEESIEMEIIEELSESQTPASSSSSVPTEPMNYSKHTNLDSKPLTLSEQIRLIRIYYLTLPKVLYCVVVLVCVVWFTFSVYSVLKHFIAQNTIAVLDYHPPNESAFPAFTFCTECVLCSNLSNSRVFYPSDVLDNNLVIAMLDEKGIERVVDDPYVPEVDIKIGCFYGNDTISVKTIKMERCKNYLQQSVSMQGGSKCLVYSPRNDTTVKMIFDYSPLFNFRVQGQWLHGGPNRGVYFSVHSPSVFPGLTNSRFHALLPGKYLDYRFSKEKSTFLPPPNKPQCFEYRTDDLNTQSPEELDADSLGSSDAMARDGTALYRSQIECYLYCMLRGLYNSTTSTLNLWTDITLEMIKRIRFQKDLQLAESNAKKKAQDPTWKLPDDLNDDADFWLKFGPYTQAEMLAYTRRKQRCLQICPQSCTVDSFLEAIVQVENYPQDNTSAYISVQWAVKPTTTLVYRVDLNQVELWGMIGGHVHVWLKVSVIQILWWFIKLIKYRQLSPIYRCCLVNWLQRKRTFKQMNSHI